MAFSSLILLFQDGWTAFLVTLFFFFSRDFLSLFAFLYHWALSLVPLAESVGSPRFRCETGFPPIFFLESSGSFPLWPLYFIGRGSSPILFSHSGAPKNTGVL